MVNTITVSFACNGDHGEFLGRVSAIDLADAEGNTIALVCTSEPGPAIAFEAARFHVGGSPFIKRGHAHAVGNWCWDEVAMDLPEATRLIRCLLANSWAPESVDMAGSLYEVMKEFGHG